MDPHKRGTLQCTRLGSKTPAISYGIDLGSFHTVDWTAFQPAPTGWELNARGKLGPRVMNLGPTMDPRQLAEAAVDLNLKLMRWRAAPALDTARLAATKCLLLGAGARLCLFLQHGTLLHDLLFGGQALGRQA